MKKSILALTAVLTLGSAMAQTTGTTTSTTSMSTSTLDKILENTSVSYYGLFTKSNATTVSNLSRFRHEVTATYNYGSGSVYVRPRFQSFDGDDAHAQWLNPRMGVRPWRWENGNFSSANEIRLEAAMDNTGGDGTDTETHYGIARYAQTLSYKINDGLSVTGWAGLYENITTDDASESQKDTNELWMDVAISYAINDAHSILFNYEMGALVTPGAVSDSDEDLYFNDEANNTFYLRYTNSMIKDVSITPGVNISRASELDVDNVGVSLELSATI